MLTWLKRMQCVNKWILTRLTLSGYLQSYLQQVETWFYSSASQAILQVRLVVLWMTNFFSSSMTYLTAMKFVTDSVLLSQKPDHFRKFITPVCDNVERCSIYKIFSSFSGLRVLFYLSPCLHILCTSSVKQYYIKNNNLGDDIAFFCDISSGGWVIHNIPTARNHTFQTFVPKIRKNCIVAAYSALCSELIFFWWNVSEGCFLVGFWEHLAAKCRRSVEVVPPCDTKLRTFIIIHQASTLWGDFPEGDTTRVLFSVLRVLITYKCVLSQSFTR